MKKSNTCSKVSILALCGVALVATGHADSGAAKIKPPTNILLGANERAVKGDNVNVRSRPSTTAEVVAQLRKGDRVEVVETKRVTEAGKAREWACIQLPATAKCFVSAKYVKDGTVSEDAVYVRCGAGTNFKDVAKLAKGTKVEAVKTTGEWTQIKPTAQCQGWVAAEFLEGAAAPLPPSRPLIAATETILVTNVISQTVTQIVEREVAVQLNYIVRDGYFQTVRADEPAEPKHLSNFELLTEEVGRLQHRIAYLEIAEKELQKFEGKHVRVLGTLRWTEGNRYPVIVVERIEMVW
jgi:SH3-like domain-containing protein